MVKVLKKYVKNPYYVKAVKWSGREDDDMVHKFRNLGIKFKFGLILADGDKCELEIEVPDGIQTVMVGDYIIELPDGSMVICKPDIFEQSYKLVEEQSPGGTFIDGVRQ